MQRNDNNALVNQKPYTFSLEHKNKMQHHVPALKVPLLNPINGNDELKLY